MQLREKWKKVDNDYAVRLSVVDKKDYPKENVLYYPYRNPENPDVLETRVATINEGREWINAIIEQICKEREELKEELPPTRIISI